MSFQRFQCEVESKQLDTRLAQYLRHKSTVSLPPNLTERSLVHFIPALRLLKPHVKKSNISQNLLAPEWRTLFEECQFFLQECQIKFLIPSRKYQTLGNDYSATQKSLQARVPQQEQSNNEIGYRPAERNCFLLSSTKVCLPIPYTIRPKTLPHKMTRQPRVHTNPNAKTAEPSKRLINKNAIVPPHSNIGFIARKCSVEKRFSFREK